MRVSPPKPVSGHVFKVERKRGAQWYAKYRLPDGRQVQKLVGPHWTDRRIAAPAGYFTKTSAQRWLDDTLAKARRGELPGQVKTATTLLDAFDEWLVYKRDRKIKLSTQIDYENMVTRYKQVFGEKFGSGLRPEEVTAELVEEFRDALIAEGLSDRTVNKYLTVLHGVFVWAQRRFKLPANPVANVERRPHAKRRNIDVFSREEILALVRVAESEQDAAIFLTAAFTGLRLGELLALRWRDVEFGNCAVHVRQNFTNGRVDTPKSGEERTVPLADEVAAALAKLRLRASHRGDDDLVFCGGAGGHLAGHRLRDATRRRCGKPDCASCASTTCATPSDRTNGRLARGHGVDGTSRPRDDSALPPVQAAPGRGPADLRCIRRLRLAKPGPGRYPARQHPGRQNHVR